MSNYLDFDVTRIIWLFLVIGLVLGAGACWGWQYFDRHVDVEIRWVP